MSLVPPRTAPFASKRSPRIRIGLETKVDPHELNQLLTRAGYPVRDSLKLKQALDHSLFCITARTISGRVLMGFVRAAGDGIFNAAVLDWIVDPTANNPDAIKRQLIERVKQEAKRSMSQCAVSIFADPNDYAMLKRAGFDEEPNGIKAMEL